MNIVLLTSGGKVIVRPDTTRARDGEDVYMPEFVKSVTYTPVLYAKISRPGRSIGEKFAGRYFEEMNAGVLLYPENLIDGTPEGYACASCIDRTSVLPFSLVGKEADCEFRIEAGSGVISSFRRTPGLLERAIAETSLHCYLRNGDYVAVELAGRSPLPVTEEDGICSLRAFAGKERILDLRVFF